MEIQLYKYHGEENVIDKSLMLISVTTLTGTLRDGSNLLTPSIMIEDNDNLILIDKPNYCYIPEFNRYYYITNVSIYRNVLRLLSLKVDVLYSFHKEPLLSTPLYVSRRTNGNIDLYDDQMPFKFKKDVSIVDEMSSTDYYPNEQFGNNVTNVLSYRVVISAVAGGLLGFDYQDTSDFYGLPSITSISTGENIYNKYYVINFYQLQQLVEKIVQDSTLISWIKAVTVLPFEPERELYLLPSSSNPITFIRIGNSQIIFDDYTYEEEQEGEIVVVHIPQYTYKAKYGNHYRYHYFSSTIPSKSDYKEYTPFTRVEMYIPYVGYKELNLESVRGCGLDLLYVFDFDSATSSFILYNRTKQTIEEQGSCNVGVKIGLTTSNQREIQTQVIQSVLNSTLSSFVGAFTSYTGLGMLNNKKTRGIGESMATAGVLKGYTSLAGSVDASSMFVYGKTDVSSSHEGCFGIQKVKFRITKQVKIINAVNYQYYIENIGLPYNQYTSINSLDIKEFFVVGDVSDVPYIDGITKPELDELKQKLQDGCYA